MTGTDPRFERLPKWARDRITRLEREVEDARREREEARLATDPAKSSALLDAWADVPIGLGKDARVRFVLGPDDGRQWADVHVLRDYTTDGLAIEIMGGDGLTVRPQSSNVVVVGLTR